MQSTEFSLPDQRRRGAIIVLAAILMVGLFAFVAFTIDWGYIGLTKNQLQNAADAAAVAGADAIPDGADGVNSAAVRLGQANFADSHPIDITAAEDVEIGLWDQDLATFIPLAVEDQARANAVRVTCRLNEARGTQLNLFFAPVLGITKFDVSASAIALRKSGNCGGVIGLNRVYLREETFTDSYNSEVGPYSAATAGDNGDVCSNGHIRLIGTAGINGDAHAGPDEDGVDMDDDNYVTGDQTLLDRVIYYPPTRVGNAATINDNIQVPQTENGGSAFDANGNFILGSSNLNRVPAHRDFGRLQLAQLQRNPFAIGPFASNSDDIILKMFVPMLPAFGKSKKDEGGSGVQDSIDLPPGTYYFKSLNLKSGSVINISGPTVIYVEGDVDLSDGGIVNQTLLPKNLQLYPLGTQTKLPEEIDFHGVIYSTTSAVEKDAGSAEFFGKIIGQKVKISGSGAVHVDESIYFPDLVSGGSELNGPSSGSVLVQ
ncbi:MAG: hypothetical protein HON53_20435 [Planctomycetaceae bacterium]|jgi:hypothetical protein|nr:hypothetical protein [Planctomycetaceae bacterium]MBT6156295.1 hypothetical protein [Planctomycetaceae bacterium]MBT6483482.1 hypothetical protein [Planctomycetaceae bacterium]MBT6494707.1 hypothetical protein [Planctomycetaceae bacterium]